MPSVAFGTIAGEEKAESPVCIAQRTASLSAVAAEIAVSSDSPRCWASRCSVGQPTGAGGGGGGGGLPPADQVIV